jgi:hypothetical protein
MKGRSSVVKASAMTAALISAMICGCGIGPDGNKGNQTPPPTLGPAMNGNWQLTLVSTRDNVTYSSGGAFTTPLNVGQQVLPVKGTLHIQNRTCFVVNNALLNIPLTGNIPASGAMSMDSALANGQTVFITGTVDAASDTITGGTYKITGGACDGDHGTLTGFVVAPLTGTYTGSFLSGKSNLTLGVASVQTQSDANTSGFYTLTGTITFTGSPCFTSGPITPSTVYGSYVVAQVTTTNGAVVFYGNATDGTGKKIDGQYFVTGGTCDGDYGSGSIARP